MYACAKEVVRKYKPYLDEIGLTYTQYITMMVMWERKRISVKERDRLLKRLLGLIENGGENS